MIETARLLLQPFDEGDLPTLVKLRSDPEVARYLGGDEWNGPEKVAERFRFYLEHQRKHGFACGRAVLRETGEIIGWGGLQHLDDTDEIEVGYGFAKEHWGRGYASEMAAAWLRHGFEVLGLERIVAIAIPENEGSWRVMEKLGMKYEKNYVSRGFECVYYALTRDEYNG
jgi:ribosomal-protein-alanine N-acetyltransferase